MAKDSKHPRRMDARLGRIYGNKGVPAEAMSRALKAKMGKATRAKVEKMAKKAPKSKEQHTHSYNHNDVGRDWQGKGGYACTSCGQKK